MRRNHTKVQPVSIAMTAEMARQIRVLAAQEGKSRSRFVREVLEKVLAGHDGDGNKGDERDD